MQTADLFDQSHWFFWSTIFRWGLLCHKWLIGWILPSLGCSTKSEVYSYHNHLLQHTCVKLKLYQLSIEMCFYLSHISFCLRLNYNSWSTWQKFSFLLVLYHHFHNLSKCLLSSACYRTCHHSGLYLVKVALNPMYRMFSHFAKSCVLSRVSKVDNIKKIHRAVFEL